MNNETEKPILENQTPTKLSTKVLFILWNVVTFIAGSAIGFTMLLLTNPPLTPMFLLSASPILFIEIFVSMGFLGWLLLGGAKSLDDVELV